MLAGCLLFLIATMLLFPGTAMGRLLHEQLVERPLARLQTVRRHHVLFLIGLVALSLIAGEMVVIMGSFDLAIVLAWDISIYVDVVIATSTLAVMGRAKAAWHVLKTKVFRSRGRARNRARRTSRPGRRSHTSANDDDEGDALPIAA